MYKKSMIAHAAGLSVALGISHEHAEQILPGIANHVLEQYIRHNKDSFREKRDRLASKLRFLESEGCQ